MNTVLKGDKEWSMGGSFFRDVDYDYVRLYIVCFNIKICII